MWRHWFTCLQNSYKSLCRVGSPQQIEIQSNNHFLFSKKLKIAFWDINWSRLFL